MKKTLLAILAIVACSVAANANVYGDVNGDGNVTVVDVTAIYNYLLDDDDTFLATSDIDGDGYITVADITIIYNIILGNESPVEPPAPVTEFTVNGVTFKMIQVEGGTYMMGVDQHVGSAYPPHEVTLSTYWMGETEVTQELWVAVMGINPSYFNEYGNADLHSNHASYDAGINLQRPVDYVNYGDCLEFCATLSQLTGKNFRLPTEAEWEFAARGGNLSHGYEFAGSDSINDVAWYKGTLPSTELWTEGWGTQTVATKAPNELGIYDMCGNVDEWCFDWFGTYSADAAPLTNPTGPETGTRRVMRGGNCLTTNPGIMKVYYRNQQNPDARGNARGLRIVMEDE
ncbi:MAG: SUMF1/EgtB/PvdO family nonheme iron enzyme [Muribaculaceae bacterium]|nr:SUMF1/EgtB/PvdO family nonheme iron enzyme [Muribaculaceae bacterium]